MPGRGELVSFRAWLHKTPALHCRKKDIVTLKKWDVCIFCVLFHENASRKKEKKKPSLVSGTVTFLLLQNRL